MTPPGTDAVRRYPCLEAVRAIAATAVIATHAAYWTGRYERGPLSGVLARLDMGVALFFALSGFLLFLPYAAAMRDGTALPRTRAYLWRRALRILPAYLVVVAAAALIEPANRDKPFTEWVRHLFFLQIYGNHHLVQGLTQTWSLATEVAFYLVLPLLAAGAVRLSGRSWRPDRLLWGAGLLVAVSLVWSWSTHRGMPPTLSAGMWLPAHLSWFAIGMAFAVMVTEVHRSADRADSAWQVLPRLADELAWWWVIGLTVFLIATTPVAGPRSLLTVTTWESSTRSLLYTLAAAAFLFPLVFRPEPVGAVRGVLGHGSLQWLGRISYSMFLVHLLLLSALYRVLDRPAFTGNFAPTFAGTWLATVAVSSALYLVVERPTLRLKDRVRRSAAQDSRTAAIPAEVRSSGTVSAPT